MGLHIILTDIHNDTIVCTRRCKIPPVLTNIMLQCLFKCSGANVGSLRC